MERDDMSRKPERKIERRRLDELQPHPHQYSVFPKPPGYLIEELAEDMEKNGQLQPVEILSDGTIIAGHKRTDAARMLGWTEIDVWVRADLDDDPAAAEIRLIEDNATRGHYSRLVLARCYLRLKQLRRGSPHARLCGNESMEFRDLIGKRFGLSGRTLDRYLRVVRLTPVEVQNAVETDDVPIAVALEVANLEEPEKQQIAAAIREGRNPREVIDELLKKSPPTTPPWKATQILVRALDRADKQLGDRIEKVGCITPSEKQSLQKGQKLIQRLLATAKVERPRGSRNGKTWIDELFA
jgi:ParB-like chromosome segregation protein Spo0J